MAAISILNRSYYINTVDGQINLRLRRNLKRILFRFETTKFKTKNSIKTTEKEYFQECVIEVLNNSKKRAFKSDVITEINFFLNQDNPPLIHSLPKNYIDLLIQPITKRTKRKRLLLDDDRQIKILIVGYNLSSSKSRTQNNGHSYFKLGTYKDFIEDLRLIERIRKNNFIDSSNYSNEIDSDDERYHDVDTDSLTDWEHNKERLVELMGTEAYELHRDTIVRDIQKKFLHENNLKIWQLIELLRPLIYPDNSTDDFYKISFKNLILSDPVTIDLKSIPTQSGETEIYRDTIQSILDIFRKKFKILFPLKTQLSVTIFYCPPYNAGIDLDNLARKIIPLINDTFQPPSTFLKSINPDNPYLRLITDDIERLKKIPKSCVTNYQIIEMPRSNSDKGEGFVRLLLEDGTNYDSIWRRIDRHIDRWAQNI